MQLCPNVQLINAAVLPLLRMQCQCQPNAELENLFSKVLLRCSLTSP